MYPGLLKLKLEERNGKAVTSTAYLSKIWGLWFKWDTCTANVAPRLSGVIRISSSLPIMGYIQSISIFAAVQVD